MFKYNLILFLKKVHLFPHFIDKKTDKERLSNLPNIVQVRSVKTIEFMQRGSNNLSLSLFF